jgi:hypothetical protein
MEAMDAEAGKGELAHDRKGVVRDGVTVVTT